MGRSARSRRRTDRRRAHGARHRARLCAGEAVSARHRSQPRRALRPSDPARNGRARAARLDHPAGIWRRRPQLRLLRADRARTGAGRFRFPFRHVGAILARHAGDLRLRQRGATPQIPAQDGDRRAARLFRTDRARPWFRSRLDDDAGRKGAGRLSPDRQQDLDHQCAGRRCRGRLGQARRQNPRLHRRARHQGILDAKDPGQAQLARLHHRRDCARWRRDPRR